MVKPLPRLDVGAIQARERMHDVGGKKRKRHKAQARARQSAGAAEGAILPHPELGNIRQPDDGGRVGHPCRHDRNKWRGHYEGAERRRSRRKWQAPPPLPPPASSFLTKPEPLQHAELCRVGHSLPATLRSNVPTISPSARTCPSMAFRTASRLAPGSRSSVGTSSAKIWKW